MDEGEIGGKHRVIFKIFACNDSNYMVDCGIKYFENSRT